MPKVVLAFGDTLQQTGPLPGRFKLRRPVLLVEFAYRVPGGTVRIEAISVAVRRRRHFERTPIDASEDENPLTDLGHAVVGSVQMDDLQVILSALPTVDRSKLVPKKLQTSFIFTIGREAYDILEEKDAR